MINFWAEFDEMAAGARAGAIGEVMTAAGFDVVHTGGGCAAWEKWIDDERYVWVCDAVNGLGESEAEPYVVGFYDGAGETIRDDCVAGIQAALAWCRTCESER